MNDVVGGEIVKDDNGKWLWRTADGRYIAVENLTDTHLRNISLFLMGFGFQKCVAPTNACVVWLRILRIEWEHRLVSRVKEKKWKVLNQNYNDLKELGE